MYNCGFMFFYVTVEGYHISIVSDMFFG